MNNPWKLATIGISLTLVTAMASGLTTAWMLSPTATAQADEARAAAAPRPDGRFMTAELPAAARPVYQTAAASRPARVTPVASAAADDCATGGDRAWRIAKPGLLGTALGAGLGAAGGAIANGGKAAGKGAIIGGLAGAALGAGYGAYKTNNECGTIFGSKTPGFLGGNSNAYEARTPAATSRAAMPRNRAAADNGRITVYNAR
ncbi:MAG: hypothetical protein WED01_01385 [Candidatus Rokuibacteriota bacterium]